MFFQQTYRSRNSHTKKCATLAHFYATLAQMYATLAHFFSEARRSLHFCRKVKRMSKKEIEKKKDLARILYMNGTSQKEVAERVSVSRVTINKWVKDEGWDEKRAAKTVTRPELVNKLLRSIDTMIEKALETDDADISGFGDKLAKISATIERLDKKGGVVSTIEVCIAFGQWLEHRMGVDKAVTPELVKQVTRLQDTYINEQFNPHKR